MMKNNNAHYIFNGYQGTSSVMFRVEFRFNKKYEIRVALVNDKAVWKNSKWIAISDAVHFFELDWSAATAVGANNGYLKLWVDGVLKQNLTKVDNDTRRLDRINLGAVEAIDKGTRGNYFFDEFVSRRRTYIGPVIADASNDTEQTLNDIDTSASLSFDLEGLSIEAIPTSNIIDTSSAILITSTNQYTPPSGYQLYGKVFDIQALYGDGVLTESLNQPFTLVIDYSSAIEDSSQQPDNLTLQYWNKALGVWELLPVTIDTENHTATTMLQQSATVALMQQIETPSQQIYLPLIQQ